METQEMERRMMAREEERTLRRDELIRRRREKEPRYVPEWVGFWVARFLAVRIAETECGNHILPAGLPIIHPTLVVEGGRWNQT